MKNKYSSKEGAEVTRRLVNIYNDSRNYNLASNYKEKTEPRNIREKKEPRDIEEKKEPRDIRIGGFTDGLDHNLGMF